MDDICIKNIKRIWGFLGLSTYLKQQESKNQEAVDPGSDIEKREM